MHDFGWTQYPVTIGVDRFNSKNKYFIMWTQPRIPNKGRDLS
jgi:hypothetical protein